MRKVTRLAAAGAPVETDLQSIIRDSSLLPSAMIVRTGKTMLGLLLVVTSCLLMTGCHGNQEFDSSPRGGGDNGQMDVDERVRRSVPVKNSVQEHLLGADLTSEQRMKRDVSDPRAHMLPKRGDWAKTNVHMWGKRHDVGLRDLLRDVADKKNSWEKTNVRMWGKRRGYAEDYNDDEEESVNRDWLSRDVDGVYLKRESRAPSSMQDVGPVILPGWVKNAWDRSNMRIWG